MKKISLIASLFAVLFMFGSLVHATDAVTVTGISITTPPAKIVYISGQVLDLTGLVVKLVKSDSTTENVILGDFAAKNITTNPTNGVTLRVGNTKITIKVNGKSVEQAITVNPVPRVNSIVIKTKPTDKYTIGALLDLTNLVVTIKKTDASTEDVAFANFESKGITTSIKNGTALKMSDKRVTVRMASARVDLPITVDVNPGCVDTALGARETAVATALNTYAGAMTTAFTARKNALAGAWWGATDVRNAAIKTAWSAFQTTQKTARNARLESVKSAWATWKTEAKKCGVISFSENQGLDTQ